MYWIAGSISILFASSFFLVEFLKSKNQKRYTWFTLPIFAIFISWLAVRLSFTGNFRSSFLPDMYYQTQLLPSILIYIPWVLLLIWIPLATYSSKFKISGKNTRWAIGFQGILLLILFGLGYTKFGDRASYDVKKMDYYARNNQWKNIITESAKTDIQNYLHLNYLNLALNEEGCLLEKMFSFNQKGTLSLAVSNQKKNLVSALLSDINFAAGNIASAQQYAFEGYETSSGGGSGRMLKRLVQTNLIYGEYAVAEKYIEILEHTFLYRKWATQQRQFLFNDSLCLKESLLAEKIHCLPQKGSRDYTTGGPETCKLLADINPTNQKANEYFYAYLLLSKNLKLFLTFLLESEQRETLPKPLPESIQQALIMCYESQPYKWKELGISEKTIKLYKAYKELFTQYFRNSNKKEIMQKQFASTYWFYFQFTNI